MPTSWCFERLESRRLLAVAGVRDLLYVRVRFSDQTAAPETATQSQEVTSTATALIQEWSGGKVSFTVTVKDVQLPKPTSHYRAKGTAAIAADATAALKSGGVNVGSFEHRSFRYAGPIGSFAGLGQMPGQVTWIKSSSATVLAHELGHNLGLRHAAFLDPRDDSNPFGAGSEKEYGDPFSNMGSGGTRDWNATEKWYLGFIGGSQVRTVSSTGTTTLTLTAHDDLKSFRASDVYLARVPIGTKAIYAEYRKNAGGVVVHVDDATRPRGGVLIDGTPTTATAGDAALKPGRSLVNPRGAGTADDIRVQVTSISGSGAVVTIAVGAAAKATAVIPPAATSPAALAAYAAALDAVEVAARPRTPRLADAGGSCGTRAA